ncbi:sulfate permease [Leucobacter sp. UCD-THU]|uniref:Sulfate permease n=1 Tax=Leucobacter chromiisoli TaxID=2796471 RepID=A0A934UV20_9MICO|nr:MULTISPECIES: hypothetical protein [Leucobacter]EYT51771.1 sulfate permease [Leucobacter sp. UCD-THU]MBK0418773.1 hypothetical protein [Leucobacter chromiisoli]
MLSTIFSGVVRCYYFLARYAPGPRLISRILRRDGLKWGTPAMLVAAPYYFLANFLKGLIEQGGDAWLSLPMLWCLVMGTVFLVLGPVSLLKLAKARILEAVQARRGDRKKGVPATKNPAPASNDE